MRWTSTGLGLVLALSCTALGSYGSHMEVGNAFRGMAPRHNPNTPGTAKSVLEARQAAGRCGSDQGGAKCPAGQCCSQWGYCGIGNEFCNPIALCQTDFGSCLGSTQSATAAPPPPVTPVPPPVTTTTPPVVVPPPTTTTRPIVTSTPTTTSTPVPPPITTTSSVPVPVSPPTSSASPPALPPLPPPPVPPGPGGALIPSPNGMCGNTTTCAGSNRGSCCSRFFWCGDGIDFCGTGCQSGFGLCFGGFGGSGSSSSSSSSSSSAVSSSSSTSRVTSSSSSSSSVATPPSSSVTSSSTSSAVTSSATTPVVTSTSSSATRSSTSTVAAAPTPLPSGVSITNDGSCGDGKSCQGSSFGRCCSQFGFCGNGDQFCSYIVACQPEWGYCDPAPAGN